MIEDVSPFFLDEEYGTLIQSTSSKSTGVQPLTPGVSEESTIDSSMNAFQRRENFTEEFVYETAIPQQQQELLLKTLDCSQEDSEMIIGEKCQESSFNAKVEQNLLKALERQSWLLLGLQIAALSFPNVTSIVANTSHHSSSKKLDKVPKKQKAAKFVHEPIKTKVKKRKNSHKK